MKRRSNSLAHLSLAVLVLALLPASFTEAQIAVVVHPENELSELSLSHLTRLYLGKQTTFENGSAVALASTAGLEEKFYQSTLRMSPYKVRRHWVKAVFAGSAGSPPESMGDGAAVCAFVSANRGGLAFLDVSEVSDAVKVLRLEGKQPGEDGYPLR